MLHRWSDEYEQNLIAELGCCQRIMKNLSNIAQEDMLKPPQPEKTEEEQLKETLALMSKAKSA